MPSITSHLSQEHQQIRRALRLLKHLAFERDSSESSLVDFERALGAVQWNLEKVHHAKEEEILFPAIDALEGGAGGGPNCSLFMGMRIEWNPAHILMARAKGSALALEPWPKNPQVENIIQKNSMLGIPLEDHEAGFMARQLIHLELNRLADSSQKEADLAGLRSVMTDFLTLMDFHIRKEDQCLFKMVEECFSPADQSALLERAMELENRLDTDKVAELGLVLEELGKKYRFQR